MQIKTKEDKTIKIIPVGMAKFSGLTSIPNSVMTIGVELGGSGLKIGFDKDNYKAEQEAFEKALQLSPGTLGKGSNWWNDFEIRLFKDKPTYFNLEEPLNYLRYKVMLASSKICNGPSEKSKWPKAEFMIEDAELEAELVSNELDIKYAAIEKLMATTIEQKRGYLRLYGKRGVDNMRETMVKAELAKFVEADPKQFLAFTNDKEIETRVLLEELVEKGIIRKNGNYYKNGDDPIGNSTDEVISYLNDPRHSSIRLALESKAGKARKSKQTEDVE